MHKLEDLALHIVCAKINSFDMELEIQSRNNWKKLDAVDIVQARKSKNPFETTYEKQSKSTESRRNFLVQIDPQSFFRFSSIQTRQNVSKFLPVFAVYNSKHIVFRRQLHGVGRFTTNKRKLRNGKKPVAQALPRSPAYDSSVSRWRVRPRIWRVF